MLMCLGPVVFDHLRFNLQAVRSGEETPFAEHNVVGAPPVYEWMGDGAQKVSLTGILHPEHFGGMGTLAALESARKAHQALPLMRGDFVPLGWFLIENLSRSDSELNEFGIGKAIEFTVELVRSDRPSAVNADFVLRLFA